MSLDGLLAATNRLPRGDRNVVSAAPLRSRPDESSVETVGARSGNFETHASVTRRYRERDHCGARDLIRPCSPGIERRRTRRGRIGDSTHRAEEEAGTAVILPARPYRVDA